MFTGGIFTIAKIWKQKNIHEHIMGKENEVHYSALKEKEILPFFAIQNLKAVSVEWMDQKDIMPSENPISKGQILYDSNYMWYLKYSNS